MPSSAANHYIEDCDKRLHAGTAMTASRVTGRRPPLPVPGLTSGISAPALALALAGGFVPQAAMAQDAEEEAANTADAEDDGVIAEGERSTADRWQFFSITANTQIHLGRRMEGECVDWLLVEPGLEPDPHRVA